MKLNLKKAKTFKQLLEIFRKGEPVPVEVMGGNPDHSGGKPDKWVVKITAIESDTHKLHFIIRGIVKLGASNEMKVAWRYKMQLPSQKHTGFIYTGDDATDYQGDDDAPVL